MKLSDIPEEFTTYKLPWYDKVFTLKYNGVNNKTLSLFGPVPCKSLIRTYWNGEVEIFKLGSNPGLLPVNYTTEMMGVDRCFTVVGFASSWDILERRVLIEKTGFYL